MTQTAGHTAVILRFFPPLKTLMGGAKSIFLYGLEVRKYPFENYDVFRKHTHIIIIITINKHRRNFTTHIDQTLYICDDLSFQLQSASAVV